MDRDSSTSSSSLVYLPKVHMYRVVVPAALMEFNGCYAGMWFKLVSFNISDGLTIIPTVEPYDQTNDRTRTKSIILEAEISGSIERKKRDLAAKSTTSTK